MSDNINLDCDEILLKKMQRFRMDIVEGIMIAPENQPHEQVRDKDPNMLRVALSAMDGVDNSIQKQRRLELDKQGQDNDQDFQRNIAASINHIMERGGMALQNEQTDAPQSIPTPQLGQLPTDVISQEEAVIGVEQIDYDELMKKKPR